MVKSRVLPAGTSILFRIMVEQAALEADADAASVKVQLDARYSMYGTRVGTACTNVAPALRYAKIGKRMNIFDSVMNVVSIKLELRKENQNNAEACTWKERTEHNVACAARAADREPFYHRKQTSLLDTGHPLHLE